MLLILTTTKRVTRRVATIKTWCWLSETSPYVSSSGKLNLPSLQPLTAAESQQLHKVGMCVTMDKDDSGLVPLTDGKHTAENGLRHIGWAVPDYCGRPIEKTGNWEAIGVRDQNTHRTRVNEATGGALADESVERDVGLGGQDHCFQNIHNQNICNDDCDLLEHEHKGNAKLTKVQSSSSSSILTMGK